MARAVWTGALSFGLVSIPVALYPATQEHEVRFHQFQRGTQSRIRYRRVNQDTGKEVDYSDIVKGAELPDGEHVVLSDEELEEVEPQRTKSIEINDFVDLASIDPVYFQKSYFVGPRDEGSRKPYALLSTAIERSGRAAVASFVLRNKEYLAVIRPYQGALLLETMFFADEVRQLDRVIENQPDSGSLRKQDVDMALNLIESMSAEWDPQRYHDRYTERVNELVEAKSKNEKFEVPEEEPGGDVVDLTAALRASIERARGGKQSQPAKPKPDVSELSKSELYDLAQQLGIAGRSKMTRQQLEKAVASAQRQQAS
jgi:DNA end-binding protein Ku